MRVLFVNRVDFMQSTLPEGIVLLSSILKKQGHEVALFDTAFLKPKGYDLRQERARDDKMFEEMPIYKMTPYTIRDLVKDEPEVDVSGKFSDMVSEFKPSLIAISTMTTNYKKSIDLIKRIPPSCSVIVGGMHPTLMPESVIREERVDFACVGEGEKALLELCTKMERGEDTTDIKNLFAKRKIRGAVEIVRNPLRSFMDLDLLPIHDLSIADERHFFRPFLGNIYKGIFVNTSRGCPRGCAYCVNNRLRDLFRECGKRYLRFQSPETVARNISALKKEYGITWFKFSDDTFLMRPLSEMYKLRDLLRPLGIMFGCSVDPVTATEEKVRLAKEMGCVAMSVGLETGNEKIRREVLDRHITNTQMRKALWIIKNHDIKVSTFNMIGLPGETRENIYETIRLNKECGVPDANVYILYPFPGTKLYDNLGISLEDYDSIPSREDSHVFNLSKVSKNDLLFYQRAFNLFLALPEKYWDKIEQSKSDGKLHRELICMAQEIVDKKKEVLI